MEHLEENDLLTKDQHGFRKGKSTLSELLEYQERIMDKLEENENVDTIFLDFSKAFDKADHRKITEKLKEKLVGGEVLKLVEDFLKERTQRVKVDGVKLRE